jgi:catechol 2,3-dioxygenase-like lactoylglutathione lyase family enzyme
MASLLAIHPVIEVGDMALAVRWYCEAVGFEVAFDDGSDPPGYVGLRRDGVELHMQSHPEPGWAEGGRCVYRFMVDDPDALLADFRERSSSFADREVHDTAWGTREFGRYDPDGNALVFYCNR